MNSITKSIPVFNAKTGIIAYAWDDLMRENPSCPHCGNRMVYWYARKRGVIISERKLVFMAPRYRCACGRTMTMRPYFIAARKQHSVFSIQEILNSDIYGDHSAAASYGSSMVTRLRKWAVSLVKSVKPDEGMPDHADDRSTLKLLLEREGRGWLASILIKTSGSVPFSVPLFSDG